MTGIDIPIPELQLTIHPPVIKDIAYMGEQKFFTIIQYICLDKEALIQDENVLSDLSNFQVLMKVLDQSQDKIKKNDLQTLFLLLFPNYNSIILPSSIILSQENTNPVIIDTNNFDIFQEYIKEVLCVNSIFQGNNIIYNPANDRAKKIADKLMKGRRKVAQLNHSSNNDSVLVRYLSILTVAQIITLADAINLNLFQLFDLMERYTAFIEWDTDVRVRLAGGTPEKTVETWMRELHTKN